MEAGAERVRDHSPHHIKGDHRRGCHGCPEIKRKNAVGFDKCCQGRTAREEITMTAQEYLASYHDIKIQIQKKREYIMFCDQRSMSIPGPSYGEKIGSNPNRNLEAPFEKWIGRKIDAEHELKELENAAVKLKVEIEDKISELHDCDLERILVYRYIDWLSWLEMAKVMYYSVATLKRKHNEAMNKIDV